MPEEETDVSFADFSGSKRLYPAPGEDGPRSDTLDADLSDQDHWEKLERETGFEPATLSLGSRIRRKK
jgi:hypothetical protein